MCAQIGSAKIWLYLLEKEQHQVLLVLSVKVLQCCVSHLLEVHLESWLTTKLGKNILPIGEDVMKEFGHKKSRSLVLFTTRVKLILQGSVVEMHLFILLLSASKLLFDKFELIFKKVDHFFVIICL